jgi:hypothetical protein
MHYVAAIKLSAAFDKRYLRLFRDAKMITNRFFVRYADVTRAQRWHQHVEFGWTIYADQKSHLPVRFAKCNLIFFTKVHLFSNKTSVARLSGFSYFGRLFIWSFFWASKLQKILGCLLISSLVKIRNFKHWILLCIDKMNLLFAIYVMLCVHINCSRMQIKINVFAWCYVVYI